MRKKIAIHLLISTISYNCCAAERELDIVTIPQAGISTTDPRKSLEYLFLDSLYQLLESKFDGHINYKAVSPNIIINTLK